MRRAAGLAIGMGAIFLAAGAVAMVGLHPAAPHRVPIAPAAQANPADDTDWSGSWSGSLVVTGSPAACPFTVTVPLTVRMSEVGSDVSGTARTGAPRESGCVLPGTVRPELPDRFTATASPGTLTFGDGTSLKRTGPDEASGSRPLKVNGVSVQVSTELRRTSAP
jgi:hypothetical protein